MTITLYDPEHLRLRAEAHDRSANDALRSGRIEATSKRDAARERRWYAAYLEWQARETSKLPSTSIRERIIAANKRGAETDRGVERALRAEARYVENTAQVVSSHLRRRAATLRYDARQAEAGKA